MPTRVLAKLLELTYKEMKADVPEHEIEDRLLDNLLGKSLQFTTEQGQQGCIQFHSIGRGKRSPSTVISLQISGVNFEQGNLRLSLDLRYIYYKEFGHRFMFHGSPSKFLVTSPAVQKLGPNNVLVEFVVYGNTVHQVNRSLEIFAEVVRCHQDQLHQTAIEHCDQYDSTSGDKSCVSFKQSLSGDSLARDSIDLIEKVYSDESYIEEYIGYVNNPKGELRRVMDQRNTYADSELK